MSMASSSSSSQEPLLHHLFLHGTTAAPPPTPSSQPASDDSATAAALTSLLHRLPAALSLPTSRFSRRHSVGEPKPTMPTVSLTQPRPELLSAAFETGFFQLTDHRVATQLAELAESDSAAILALTPDQKRSLFPSNWPVGFDPDDEEDYETATSFCVDDKSLTSADGLSVAGLAELTRELDRVGGEVVEMLSCELGLENQVRKCSLMWVSEPEKDCKAGNRCYPYVVGLAYQIRKQEYRLEMDTGSVLIAPQVGSILVTLGDIAQVWSNGKTKKVRGTPIPMTNGKSISMCLLVTLPLDATISPLLPRSCCAGEDNNQVSMEREKMIMKFNPIPFEDHAWRVYHERLFLKDSLDKYRI